jgi:hypothetical protein
MRPIGQPWQAVLPVARQPGVHRLAGHPIALSNLNNGNATGDDLPDVLITLLPDAQLTSISPGPS